MIRGLLLAGSGIIAVLIAALATRANRTLEVGAVLSSGLEASGHIPTVVWAFSDADLLSCRSAARVLRHAQRKYSGQVHFVALAVDTEPTVADEFLRTERLPIPIMHLARSGLRNNANSVETPLLYVARSDTVVAVVRPPSRTVTDQSTAAALDSTLQAILGAKLRPHAGN